MVGRSRTGAAARRSGRRGRRQPHHGPPMLRPRIFLCSISGVAPPSDGTLSSATTSGRSSASPPIRRRLRSRSRGLKCLCGSCARRQAAVRPILFCTCGFDLTHLRTPSTHVAAGTSTSTSARAVLRPGIKTPDTTLVPRTSSHRVPTSLRGPATTPSWTARPFTAGQRRRQVTTRSGGESGPMCPRAATPGRCRSRPARGAAACRRGGDHCRHGWWCVLGVAMTTSVTSPH